MKNFLSKYRVIIAIVIVVIIALAYFHFHNKNKDKKERKPATKPPKKKVQATTNVDNTPVTDSPMQNTGAPIPPVTEGGQDAPDSAGILPSQNTGYGGLPTGI